MNKSLHFSMVTYFRLITYFKQMADSCRNSNGCGTGDAGCIIPSNQLPFFTEIKILNFFCLLYTR